MALPPFYAFCLPILAELDATGVALSKRELIDRVAQRMLLTPADLEETIPSGQPVADNRIGWALSHMKKTAWVENPARAQWRITPLGTTRLRDGRAVEVSEIRFDKEAAPGGEASGSDATSTMELTPRERIEAATAEIAADVEATLLDRLGRVPPKRFETIVLQLLTRMGYAGKLGSTEHAGQTGDGGIDGILYLDRLQLERVYVQAKRWTAVVGASVVRDFAGAMDGESATKGVILTTSSFTADARKYVEKSPKAIRLVGGHELARLMLEFEVGAQVETVVRIPRVDEDYFGLD